MLPLVKMMGGGSGGWPESPCGGLRADHPDWQIYTDAYVELSTPPIGIYEEGVQFYVNNLQQKSASYIFMDLGEDYFGNNYTVNFMYNQQQLSNYGASMVCGVSNVPNLNMGTFFGADSGCMCYIVENLAKTLFRCEDAALPGGQGQVYQNDYGYNMPPLWCQMVKTGTVLEWKFFLDEAHTLKPTWSDITATCISAPSTATFRYFYCMGGRQQTRVDTIEFYTGCYSFLNP